MSIKGMVIKLQGISETIVDIDDEIIIFDAYFTFGWMPVKLELKGQNSPSAVSILNEVKNGHLIREEKLQLLRDIFDNSLAGASKLLHFTHPHLYAILDRRVYRYVNGEEDDIKLNEPKNYLTFLNNCREIILDDRFKQVHDSMNKKVGYEVTPCRALELVMFMSCNEFS